MAAKLLSSSKFIENCNTVHNNKYDYSLTLFSSTRNKIKIICPTHGEFEQRASAHLSGQGCKKCRNEAIKTRFLFTKEEFLKSLNTWQLENLDFSQFHYISDKEKGLITCKIHNNIFYSTPSNLKKNKRGCPICSRNLHKELVKNSKEDFIKLSIEKHGDEFDYSELPQIFHSHDYVKIKCKKCMLTFDRIAYSHCNIGHSCPKCSATKTHKILETFLEEKKVSYIRNDRNILDGKEIDLLIPDSNIGIECNGNYWHSEDILKDCNYHLKKTQKCLLKNIQLLHFFEDELLYKMDIVKSIIEQKLKICENKIFARNCQLKQVETLEKDVFLNSNHIQGKDQSKVKIGLYHKNELVSLMTFGVPRYNKTVDWELIRFCNKKNWNVVGGASKLLSYFKKTYNPKSIISYADKRISNGNLYQCLNFHHSHDSEPRYYYFPKKNPLERIHRSNFTKAKIKKKFPSADLSKTEKELMIEYGYGRIWDCGTKVYIYKQDIK